MAAPMITVLAALALVAGPTPTSETPDPFLPTIAIAGVLPQDPQDAEAAQKLAQLLADQAQWSGDYKAVMRPAEVKKKLGASFDALGTCANDASCYGAPAKAVDADRMVVGTLAREGISYRLTVTLYDRGLRSVKNVEVESVTLSTDEIAVMLPDPYNKLLEEGATRRGKLSIVTEVLKAKVLLGGEPVGFAPMTIYVAPGPYEIRVERDGYHPFEDEIVVQPGETKTIEAVLPRKPVAPAAAVAKAKPKSAALPPLLSHPGLYTAVAGVAAIAVGVYFGTVAKGIEARAEDRDGVRAITRSEAVEARSAALRANLLVGAGALFAAGGAAWIVVTLPKPPVRPSGPSGPEPTALWLGVGGAF